MNATHRTDVLTGSTARHNIGKLVLSATRTINLLTYAISFTPILDTTLQPTVWSLLTAAPRRGIRCTAVIASHAEGSPHQQNNNVAADELQLAGWTVRRYPQRPVMHAKLIIIDEAALIAGSHNLTRAALEHNRELSILTRDPTAVYDAANWFAQLFNESRQSG
jgi:phosphatidylserine/phosphatidylglycerophosphate/cardiolipin synthase-like enzyme